MIKRENLRKLVQSPEQTGIAGLLRGLKAQEAYFIVLPFIEQPGNNRVVPPQRQSDKRLSPDLMIGIG